MKKLFVAMILALLAVPVSATEVSDWFVSGNLSVVNMAGAGSGGLTGAVVSGGVRADSPGVSVVGSDAWSVTGFGSISDVGCGECGPSAYTLSAGFSDASGGAFTALAPGADGIATYDAIGGSGGWSEAEKGFDLELFGNAGGGDFVN